MIRRLVILGAKGDLSARYLLPALARLLAAQQLPPDIRVLGVAREPGDDSAFRSWVGGELARHAPELDSSAHEALAARVHYACADVTDAVQMAQVSGNDEPVLVYLALPPAIYQRTVEALCDAGLPAGSRLVIEKPFGHNLDSARELNRLIADRLDEQSVFRIDHFLGMQTVQNILGLRFANRVFETLWHAAHVARVDIVWDETLALESRAGYYDATGALIDMVQSCNCSAWWQWSRLIP